jgi:hypothetical protein
VNTSRALRAAAVVAAFLVPIAGVALGSTAAIAGTPAVAKVCSSTVKSDFNDDGFADVAVTQGNFTKSGDIGETAVRVLYGSSTGVSKTNNMYIDGSGIPGANPLAAEDLFGISTATGDFNGDGCADLAISAAGLTTDDETLSTNGEIVVLYGSKTGLSRTDSTVIHESAIVPTDADQTIIGASSAAGNFDGDGFDDLVVGGIGEHGGIAVLYGSADGLSTSRHQWLNQGSPGVIGTNEADDDFGTAVAAGDFNGDGKCDIAVGADEQTVGSAEGAGTVTVLLGSATGITGTGSQQWNQNSTSIPGTAEDEDGFGFSLAAGNITSKTHADLIVGTPFEAIGSLTDAGTITLIKGGASGLTGTGSQSWDQNSTGVPGTSEKEDQFGTSVTIGDFNGDGHGDVAVGVPGEAVGSLEDAGEVNVLRGSSAGLTSTGAQGWTQNSTGIGGSSETGDELGDSVSALDVKSGARDELVIGVPGEDSSAKTDNGLLNIIPGGSAGLTATGSQSIDGTGLVNGPVSYGEMGLALNQG